MPPESLWGGLFDGGEPPDSGLPWWLRDELPEGIGTVLVRCLAAVSAVLADRASLPPNALVRLMEVALLRYAEQDGDVVECLSRLCEAVASELAV